MATLTCLQKGIIFAAEKHAQRMTSLSIRRGMWDEDATVFSIDLEMYEDDSSKILEVGLAWVRLRDGFKSDQFNYEHFIIEEHIDLRNGFRRGCEKLKGQTWQFRFGASKLVSLEECAVLMGSHFQNASEEGDIFLTGHSVDGDMNWLSSLNLALPSMEIVDVAAICQWREQRHDKKSLQKMLEDAQIKHSNLHNAGNDAAYTLLLLWNWMTDVDNQRQDAGSGDSLL
jgi:hypothetical protein